MTYIGTNIHPVFNTQKGEERNEYFKLNRRGAVPAYSVQVSYKLLLK